MRSLGKEEWEEKKEKWKEEKEKKRISTSPCGRGNFALQLPPCSEGAAKDKPPSVPEQRRQRAVVFPLVVKK